MLSFNINLWSFQKQKELIVWVLVFASMISMSQVNLLGVAFPVKIFGKSIFLVLPYLVLILSVIFLNYKNHKIKKKNFFYAIFIAMVFMLIASFAHLHLYSKFYSLLHVRFAFQIMLSLAICISLKNYIGSRSYNNIILCSIILVSFTQIVGYFLFPEIQIVKDENEVVKLAFDAESTRDGLLGYSFVAYHCVLGLFIIRNYDKIRWYNLLIASLFVFTIFYTQNRLAIIFMPILFTIILYRYLINTSVLVSILFLIALSFVAFHALGSLEKIVINSNEIYRDLI